MANMQSVDDWYHPPVAPNYNIPPRQKDIGDTILELAQKNADREQKNKELDMEQQRIDNAARVQDLQAKEAQLNIDKAQHELDQKQEYSDLMSSQLATTPADEGPGSGQADINDQGRAYQTLMLQGRTDDAHKVYTDAMQTADAMQNPTERAKFLSGFQGQQVQPEQPKPIALNSPMGRVNPQGGIDTIYTPPEEPQRPILASPGTVVLDPKTMKPIFTAPMASGGGGSGGSDDKTTATMAKLYQDAGTKYLAAAKSSAELADKIESGVVDPIKILMSQGINAAGMTPDQARLTAVSTARARAASFKAESDKRMRMVDELNKSMLSKRGINIDDIYGGLGQADDSSIEASPGAPMAPPPQQPFGPQQPKKFKPLTRQSK